MKRGGNLIALQVCGGTGLFTTALFKVAGCDTVLSAQAYFAYVYALCVRRHGPLYYGAV